MHRVTITAPIYYTDEAQVGEQQAFGGLGLQSDPTVYLENWRNEIGLNTNPEEVGSLWDSSAETLPLPKMPDTSFKSKPRNIPPVGAAQGGTRLDLEEKQQSNPRGLEQEGDNGPTEIRSHTGSGKDAQP